MHKTIKKDYQRKVLERIYLTDNDSLEYTLDENKMVIASIRYIEMGKINEAVITIMTLEEYTNDLSKLLEISENNDAIAVFKKNTENNYELRNVYSLKDHIGECSDFIDCAYNLYFPNKKLDKHLIRI